ncbi:hypothetical protein DH2020_026728 [Rehmannia glutinosa]|uniref:Uncharacterized protein n=1 Tax=Rehmannia glutinosa TaxID=99300 RepID=A0ABR0VW91_REHGL
MVSMLSDPKSRSCLYSLFVTMCLICAAFFICSAWLGKDPFTLSPGLGLNDTQQFTEPVECEVAPTLDIEVIDPRENTDDKCRPTGSEALPRGIVSTTTNLEMHPLSGPLSNDFLGEDFVVMLFHYDGIVDEWRDFEWNGRVLHVSARNQTKWWFAKRFLHPDVVAEYEYIFLWDEDLGVENFRPGRYLSIINEEGLEISQPALDLGKSEVHHHITVRSRRSKVHRRYYRFKPGGSGTCDGNSTAPPCVGWVEMMAPVFSKAAWRCVWYMIQNDLIHAWGLDMQLGYCAQGDRTAKVGVVDEQYIVHLGLPTLGGIANKTMTISDQSSPSRNLSDSESPASSDSYNVNKRVAIRARSAAEMRAFRNRWNKAVKEDECWVDPFEQQQNVS